jgi:glutathione S-transferase
MRLYTYSGSANAYKAELLLHQLDVAYDKVEVAIFAGAGKTPEFLRRNPAGRVPVLELDDGAHVVESNAILWHLARGTPFVPDDARDQTRVLSWMFFEQSEIEPVIGSARFWIMTGRDRDRRDELERRLAWAKGTLALLDAHLGNHKFLVGERYTIADIAVYAYTHLAADCGFAWSDYPAVAAWCRRIEEQPRFIAGPGPYTPDAQV